MVDPDKIRMLVELMAEHDLLEISLRDGEEEIHLKRPGASSPCEGMGPMIYSPQMPMMPPGGYPMPSASGVPAASGTDTASPSGMPEEDAGLAPITSPMVEIGRAHV